MDELYLNLLGNLFRNCEAEVKPLLHLIIPMIQWLFGDQEELVGGGQGFHIIIDEVDGPEEVQQPPHFMEVIQQVSQGCSNPGSSCSGSKAYRRLKQIIR